MEFNESQIKGIQFYKGCCNVIASAGSGKTGVLVNRIVNLIKTYEVSPKNILAITFSKKAKENIENRLEKLLPFQYKSINIETFHSLGYKIIRMYSDENYEILSQDWKKVKILNDIYKSKYRDELENINDVIQYISMRKNNLISPKESNKQFPIDIDYDFLYEQYEASKQYDNLIDYDDMLIKAYETLKSNNESLEYCQNEYKFVLVDEMQDINKAQYEIIKLISNGNDNLFVVGDPLQNIFEWRGSNNKFIMDFDKDWKNASVINLNTNYRSSDDIIQFANRFARNLPESKFKYYKDSESDKPPFKSPEWKSYKNEFEESDEISKKILELANSDAYNYKDIAVLARTNAQLQTFESALHNNNVSYQIVDGQSFTDRKEIKLILSYLKLSNDLNDNQSFEYVYNKPNRWLGKQFLNEVNIQANKSHMSMYCAMFCIDRRNWKFKDGINELCTVINHLKDAKFKTVKQQIQYIRNTLYIDKYISSDLNPDEHDADKVENLNSLESLASKYTNTKEFIEYIDSLAKKNLNLDDCVQLMTIHKSKGLEFPVVFLIGLNEGTLPHYRNDNINEEMRLAYVAITRAENELYCSSTKSLYGKSMEISSFKEMMFDDAKSNKKKRK